MHPLERTKALLDQAMDSHSAQQTLLHVLEATLELVSLPGNDFSWSSWRDAAHAQTELEGQIALLQTGALPNRQQLLVLFAATGPLQELAMASGWAEVYLQLAAVFDAVERRM
ncbi:hypothetical protein ACFIQF_09790 [Comamonas sp. J-3]|uniref:hypothetical protein n=1 Tax=Comamonas trifloxystrobinivorans TaxID=3350256 RepID=UPI003728D9E9